jgi:hypothetical protein
MRLGAVVDMLGPHLTALAVVDMVPFLAGAEPYVRGVVPNMQQFATVVLKTRGWPHGSSPAMTSKSR